MSDRFERQVSRRQLLTWGLAVAGGVVGLRPRAGGAENAKASKDVARWALLSDTHIAASPKNHFRGFYPHLNLRKVTAEIAADLPDGLVVTGDIARSRGSQGAYESAKALLAPLAQQRPIYLAVGNHDNRQDLLHAFQGANADTEIVKDKHVLTVMAGPVRMIILDTLLYVNMFPGMLGRPQRTWLETYLRLCDDTPTILFLHHTPRADLLDTRRLFEIIGPCKKVKAVVYGHSHKYEFREADGLQLINLPASGYNFTSAQPVGWVEAKLTRESGEFILHAVGGNPKRDGRSTMIRWRA
ncbi:MAG: metallophosphoesterase [Planctomycetes bacterium]|jgi:3',5'-cyclic AMP phosphodiesterase CpdA|nr:metallophosphoesterase [Planctomycetota bacterium]